MSSTVDAEIRVKFVDAGASKGLKAVTQAAEQSATKSVAAAKAAASQSVKAAKEAASQSTRSVQAAHDHNIKLYKDMAEARKNLGVRAEQAVREEISKTQAAYKLLASSGSLSARELGRAYDAQLSKVKALRQELGEVNKLSRISPGAVAGVASATMLAKPAVARAMGYDHSVAQVTNSLFSDRDAAGRIAGKAEVKAAISEALKQGGGDRDQAAQTLSALISSGEFSKDSAFKMLGTIQKAATGSGADSTQLADIALAAKRGGISEDQLPAVISKAIRAGQLGGFELSDMAKHLPAVMSSARGLGITGMAGFERVLTSLQASVTTAGTKDEAANNLINLLEKVNISDTAKDFSKQGIDLRSELAKGAGRGQDALTTFTSLIDQVIAKDPKAKAASQELDRLSKIAEDKKNPGREQALKAMQSIYESADIGKFLQDRQALQGFRAEQQGTLSSAGEDSLVQRVRAGIKADNGQELGSSFSVMNDSASVQMQRLANANAEGQDKLLTSAGGPMKAVFQSAVGLAEEFPILTASAAAAAAALGLVAASAGINSIAGGKSAGGVLSKASSTLSATSGAGLLKGAGVMGAIYSASELAQSGMDWVNQKGLTAIYGEEKANRLMGQYNRFVGGSRSDSPAVSGDLVANAGQLYNNPLPGGVLDSIAKPQQAAIDATANLQIGLAPGLVLQSQSTQSNGLNMNTSVGNTGNFFAGAPR